MRIQLRPRRERRRWRDPLVDLGKMLVLTENQGMAPDVMTYRTSGGERRVVLLDHSRCAPLRRR